MKPIARAHDEWDGWDAVAYQPDDPLVEAAALAARTGRALLLVGEWGLGKSAFAAWWAVRSGRSFVRRIDAESAEKRGDAPPPADSVPGAVLVAGADGGTRGSIDGVVAILDRVQSPGRDAPLVVVPWSAAKAPPEELTERCLVHVVQPLGGARLFAFIRGQIERPEDCGADDDSVRRLAQCFETTQARGVKPLPARSAAGLWRWLAGADVPAVARRPGLAELAAWTRRAAESARGAHGRMLDGLEEALPLLLVHGGDAAAGKTAVAFARSQRLWRQAVAATVLGLAAGAAVVLGAGEADAGLASWALVGFGALVVVRDVGARAAGAVRRATLEATLLGAAFVGVLVATKSDVPSGRRPTVFDWLSGEGRWIMFAAAACVAALGARRLVANGSPTGVLLAKAGTALDRAMPDRLLDPLARLFRRARRARILSALACSFVVAVVTVAAVGVVATLTDMRPDPGERLVLALLAAYGAAIAFAERRRSGTATIIRKLCELAVFAAPIAALYAMSPAPPPPARRTTFAAALAAAPFLAAGLSPLGRRVRWIGVPWKAVTAAATWALADSLLLPWPDAEDPFVRATRVRPAATARGARLRAVSAAVVLALLVAGWLTWHGAHSRVLTFEQYLSVEEGQSVDEVVGRLGLPSRRSGYAEKTCLEYAARGLNGDLGRAELDFRDGKLRKKELWRPNAHGSAVERLSAAVGDLFREKNTDDGSEEPDDEDADSTGEGIGDDSGRVGARVGDGAGRNGAVSVAPIAPPKPGAPLPPPVFVADSATNAFHVPTCELLRGLPAGGYKTFSTLGDAVGAGFEPCEKCLPKGGR